MTNFTVSIAILAWVSGYFFGRSSVLKMILEAAKKKEQ